MVTTAGAGVGVVAAVGVGVVVVVVSDVGPGLGGFPGCRGGSFALTARGSGGGEGGGGGDAALRVCEQQIHNYRKTQLGMCSSRQKEGRIFSWERGVTVTNK